MIELLNENTNSKIANPSLLFENEYSFSKNDLLKVYPIPAKDYLTIEYAVIGANNASLQVFNVDGVKVIEKQLNKNLGITSIEVNNLPAGTYLLNISGYTKTFTVVK